MEKYIIDFDEVPACEGRIRMFKANDEMVDPVSIIGKRIVDIRFDEETDEVHLFLED